MLNRRACLALTGAALPFAARGQTPEPAVPAPPVPPQMPVLTPPPVPATAVPLPALAPGVSSSVRPVPPGPVDRTKTYFLFFEQTIDVPSIRTLRRQLTTLVEGGVSEINLVIQSPGGLVYQALAAYSFIRALPATVNTHATGLVASAANLLFLAGQQRSADRNARFFFHASQGMVAGTVTGTQLQDRLAQFAAVNAMEAEVYHDRTSLTDQEIGRFEHEEVFYGAEQAKQAGIVQVVADLRIPGEQKARVLFLE